MFNKYTKTKWLRFMNGIILHFGSINSLVIKISKVTFDNNISWIE